MSELTMSHGELLAASVPADDVIAVSSGVPFALCRGLLVQAEGTATLIMASGSTRTDVPLQSGYNPLRCTQVTLGSASGVWALY